MSLCEREGVGFDPHIAPQIMDYKLLVNLLKEGKTVKIRPRGNSMQPKIYSKDEITISPALEYGHGDIVFCRVKGNYYIHLVTAIKDGSYQISNNHGHVNGWTRTVFGKVVAVNGKNIT
jgi:phage repressor protein C with HTH and peptisase S24 domain